MGYGYYSMRYVSDFVPALVFGGCVGVALLLRAVGSRRRLGISVLGVLVAATVFSTLAHVAVGYYMASVSTGGSRLRAYVQHQVTLSGHGLSDRVTVSDEIPSHDRRGKTDELVVVNDCSALYLNTGDAYRPWVAVAARDLVVSVARTDAPAVAGTFEVFETSSGWTGTLETSADGRGRVVLEPPPDSPELNTLLGDWQDLVAGLEVRVENDTELEFYRVSATPGGQVGGISATEHDADFDYSPVGVTPVTGLTRTAADLGYAASISWTPAPSVCRGVAALR